jgi:hypothetical protein
MWENIENWIPMEDCIHNGLYRIHARNFAIGIYDKEKKAFYGKRRKFKEIFIWPEDHWDTGEPFGTVKPIELLETYDGEGPKMAYLTRKEEEYKETK